ncbi:hypothetical protein AQ490_23275 [Wenjunlia vitaminophila]|uniref:Uncharacterized protein n=1 Tax=Wenjunlia vitaminophila TaxID=76728 RepID=A0A0T6LRQ5_WENVI|nr:hypothetical protein [Wenjunlia vitaminophila]KRV48795.1 hypothetical protein AQ490_23275 [Wenjunlia vitaminophila]
MAVTQPIHAPTPVVTVVPWWARAFTATGRPVVAVVVMIMCAPGEHHLGVLAGWDPVLAWGMAGVLAAYAGIAAVVATRRPKGAPGKRSAVVGAWLSLAAAMAAQPVSHLFVTGHWSASPRAPMWLVVAVSCVPPLVLGHLLHLAATPAAVGRRTTADTPSSVPVVPPVPTTPPPAAPAPAAPTYTDPRCTVIRALYNTGTRPTTSQIRDALTTAGHGRVGDSTIRGFLRAEVERHEPHLAVLPPSLARPA